MSSDDLLLVPQVGKGGGLKGQIEICHLPE